MSRVICMLIIVQYVQPSMLTGLFKYSVSGYDGAGLQNALKWQYLVLASILLHRYMLMRLGEWDRESIDSVTNVSASKSLAAPVVVTVAGKDLEGDDTRKRTTSITSLPPNPPVPVAITPGRDRLYV